MRVIRVAIVALVATASPLYAQTTPSQAKHPAAAARNILGTIPLPAGRFHGWCGRDGRFIVRNASGASLYHESGRQIAELSFPLPREFQCNDTGDAVVFYDPRVRSIVSYDVRSSTLTPVGMLKGAAILGDMLLSPNRKFIAYPTGPHPDVEDPGIALVAMPGEHFHWSGDSRLVFSLKRSAGSPRDPAYAETVTVRDVVNGRTLGGKLPAGYLFYQHVGFADGGRELILFLKLHREDVPGDVFRCRLEPFGCRRIFKGLEEVSFAEDGTIALVSVKYNKPPRPDDPHSYVLPDRHLVRVLNPGAKAIFQEEYPGRDRWGFRVKLTPLGERVALTWSLRTECQFGAGMSPCQGGMILELRGRP